MLVELLAEETGLNAERVLAIARSANHRYKTYWIAKRNGDGYREIAHPSRELKVLQAWLAVRLFALLPVHDAVYSYRRGRGIVQNANAHRQNNYLLRLDIRDFFPSIKTGDIRNLLEHHRAAIAAPLRDDDISLISTIVTHNGGLPIGAPSSPSLSNAILFPLDQTWAARAREEHFTYTRYADDLYFSTNAANLLGALPVRVAETLTAMDSPRFRLNHDKTVFTSRKRQRCVTGLILTSTDKISVGHDKKRAIRSLIHKFLVGQLSEEDASYLRGFLAYANAVEPTFLVALRRKYGEENIRLVLSTPSVPRKSRNMARPP